MFFHVFNLVSLLHSCQVDYIVFLFYSAFGFVSIYVECISLCMLFSSVFWRVGYELEGETSNLFPIFLLSPVALFSYFHFLYRSNNALTNYIDTYFLVCVSKCFVCVSYLCMCLCSFLSVWTTLKREWRLNCFEFLYISVMLVFSQFVSRFNLLSRKNRSSLLFSIYVCVCFGCFGYLLHI